MDGNTKLRYVQEVLEENLDLIWQDRLIYSPRERRYRTVNFRYDFKNEEITYVRLADKKKNGHMAKVRLNNKTFIIEIEGVKIDVSAHWQELLNQKLVLTTTK